MRADEQGTGVAGRRRYQAIPRTLVFLFSTNPQSGEREILLLKGAPEKRLWAGKYNGLGGHVERDEDVLMAALREVHEETGHGAPDLTLRGVVNIETGHDEEGPRPGVLMFVFVGETQERALHGSEEGMPEWLPLERLGDLPLVDDLYELLPRLLAGGFVYGRYAPLPDGSLEYTFRSVKRTQS